MIRRPIEAAPSTLDARWIIALWVAIHDARGVSVAEGELVLERNAVRTAAGKAILALATQLDPATADALRAALAGLVVPSETASEIQVEDALKRLGIRLFDKAGADSAPLSGMAVAGFGKIAWTADEA